MIIEIAKVPDLPILDNIPIDSRKCLIGLWIQASEGPKISSGEHTESRRIKDGAGIYIPIFNLISAVSVHTDVAESSLVDELYLSLVKELKKCSEYPETVQAIKLSIDEVKSVDAVNAQMLIREFSARCDKPLRKHNAIEILKCAIEACK